MVKNQRNRGLEVKNFAIQRFDRKHIAKNPDIIAKKDPEKPFKCTLGWVSKFRERHRLVDRARTHVAQCNNHTVANDRKSTIEFLARCKDIYLDYDL